MSRNAAPLRQIVDQGLDDLLTVVLALQHAAVPAKTIAKMAAEREERHGPRWRLAHHGKPLGEREISRRRFRKKCGAESPMARLSAGAGGSAQATPVGVLKSWLGFG